MSFSPKKSTRLSPNISLPLTLSNQCLNAATKILTETANNQAILRKSREKKAIRDYLSKNLTPFLRQDILQRALELGGAHAVLNLLDLFEPRQDAKDSVDLVGPSSLRYGCSRSGKHKWFIRPLEQYNLTLPQLEQLYNILIWSNRSSELRMLALSVTSSDVLKASKIPNILARGRALTKVTLLGCADNHTLRILGIKCPRLKYLDISNSISVTDQGLLNLLLSRPPRRKEKIVRYIRVERPFEVEMPILENYVDLGSREKNPCAETIAFIKFPCTSITPRGSMNTCKLLENSYLFVSLPSLMIVRIVEPGGIWKNGIPYDRVSRLFLPFEGLSTTVISSVCGLLDSTIERGVLQDHWQPLTLLDYVILPEKNSMLFIRTFGWSVPYMHFKTDSENVTSLIFAIDGMYRITLLEIGILFPFLKSFRGWIHGTEFPGHRPFLPNLEVLSAWCGSSIPMLSILRLAPSIKLLELNQWLSDNRNEDVPEDMKLTDDTLEECLRTNRRLAESLEEIIFSPTKLTVTSLRALISSCPNLKIIGDLQSWKISSRQIKSFNNHLNKVNSKCVLSVMNLPPPRIQNFKWI